MQKIIQIPNFSNYEVYPFEGKVWSCKSKCFIGSIDKDGYVKCSLKSDNKNTWSTRMHRVIYIACYGEIPEGYEVNHIDENKENNCIDNLNLLTHTENVNWGTRNQRTSQALKGKKKSSWNQRLKPTQKKRLQRKIAAYKNNLQVYTFNGAYDAEKKGFNHTSIYECCNGKRKTHKGFTWKFV